MVNDKIIQSQIELEDTQEEGLDLPNNSLKTKKLLAKFLPLFLLLVVLGGGIFFGYKYVLHSKTFQVAQPKLPDETILPTATPTADFLSDRTENWKIYTNKRYTYQIKYPKEWVATDSPDGEQVEIYDQSNKTETAGSILIEGISSAAYENSLTSIATPIESNIGGMNALCSFDGLSKTWCYFSHNQEYFSLLTVKKGDNDADVTQDLILSTLKFGNNNGTAWDNNDPKQIVYDYLTAYVNKDWEKAKGICPDLQEKIAEGYGFSKFEITDSVFDENGNYHV